MLVLLHSSMIAWSSSGAILHFLPAFTSVDMTMTMPVCTCKLPTPMKDYYLRTRVLDNSVLTLEINTSQFYTEGLTQGVGTTPYVHVPIYILAVTNTDPIW